MGEQCRLVSAEEARGWIALLTADVDGQEEEGVAIFCPECAGVEFGTGSWRTSPRTKSRQSMIGVRARGELPKRA